MGDGNIFRNLNLYPELFFLANRTIMDEIHNAGHMASRTDLVLRVPRRWEKNPGMLPAERAQFLC